MTTESERGTHVVASYLQDNSNDVSVVSTSDSGLGVCAKRSLKEGTLLLKSLARTCIALNPDRRNAYCGYCARPSLIQCRHCNMMAVCVDCKPLLKWHTQSGECNMFQALVESFGSSIDATLLLTMRLMWRKSLETRDSTTRDTSMSKPPKSVDWKLFDFLYSSPTSDSQQQVASSLLATVKAALATKGDNTKWLNKETWCTVFSKVRGCAHAITNNCLPLGQQLLGQALFLEHSFYNHDCAPNAFLSCAQDGGVLYGQVYLLKDVAQGDPITLSYIPMSGLAKSERQQLLQDRYHFTCKCNACSNELLEKYVGLPDGTDTDSLREIQYSINNTLSLTNKEPLDDSDIQSCCATLGMLQRGIANQGLPQSHEVVLELHRLWTKAYSLLGDNRALEQHQALFEAMAPIHSIFDPVTKATQHLEFARDCKRFSEFAKCSTQYQLGLECAMRALGSDHAFVQMISREQAASLSPPNKRMRVNGADLRNAKDSFPKG